MLMPSFSLYTVFVWLIFGAISAYLANVRGKNPFHWFFLGMFFGIFGLFFLFFSPKPKKAEEPELASVTIDITPTVNPAYQDKIWYVLNPANERQGPMSYHGLMSLWKEGSVNGETLVWNENLDDWKPLKDLTV